MSDTNATTELESKPTRNKKTLIGVAIAAVAVVVVIGVVAAVLLFSNVLGGSSSASASSSDRYIADLEESPDELWSYSFARSSDEFVSGYPNIRSVSDNTALVWSSFDSWAWESAQGDSYGWYDGYTEDYAEGYSAGEAYTEAYTVWANDFTGDVAFPSLMDYYPADSFGDSPRDGWWQGFDDAEWGYERGTNEVQAPVEPNIDSTVTLLDLTTGDPIWELDLEDAFVDYDPDRSLYTQTVDGASHMIFAATIWNEDSDSSYTEVVSVNLDTGEVDSTTEIDGVARFVQVDGKLIAHAYTENESWVMRLDPADVSATPIWEVDTDSAYDVDLIGPYVLAYTDNYDGYVLDPETGEEIPWGLEIAQDVYFMIIDDQLLRIDFYDYDDYELQGIADDGTDAWERPVDIGWFAQSEDMLLVALSDEYGEALDRLRRLDVATGEDMWEQPYRPTVRQVAIVGDVILALEAERERVAMLDAETGELITHVRLSSDYGLYPWFSDNYFYIDADRRLTAYSMETGTSVWNYRYLTSSDDSYAKSIVQIGQHLALVDTERRTLSLLGEE